MAREQSSTAAVKQQLTKRLLTTEEAAAYLGLAPRTLYNGSGPQSKTPFPVQPKRIGRKLLWDIRELDTHIDSL